MKAGRYRWITILLFLFIAMSACSAINFESSPTHTSTPVNMPRPTFIPTSTQTSAPAQAFIPSATIAHLMKPSNLPIEGKLIYDVKSQDTAPEKRAPYGDSFPINRFERPFLRDMTYIPDLDIFTFNVSQDDSWFYVSIELIGNDPNNSLGIHYGVELDLDRDGFGNYIIWGNPLYDPQWTTDGIQIFQDTNHDTGGLLAEGSDAPMTGDGYETLIFDRGKGDNPDLAWVRINASQHATVQFAFSKSLVGDSFMVGVVADAGLQDVSRYDYNDRFSEEEAGSPVKNKKYYPLEALYAFDNVCRTAIGFSPSGFESQICPLNGPPPTNQPSNETNDDSTSPPIDPQSPSIDTPNPPYP